MRPEPRADEPRRGAVAACAGRGRVRIEVRDVAAPGPGELLLRLRCCGLCGTDLYKIRHGTTPEGAVLGHELVGTVVAVGAGVEGFAPGDRVAAAHHAACGVCALCRRGNETSCAVFREDLLAPGGFSDWVLLRPRAVTHTAFRLPDGLSDEAASFLEPAACVLRGIRRAGLWDQAPDGSPWTAAVLGAGAMGLLHVLALRALHSGIRVVVAEPRAERRALALRLGADAALPDAEGVTGAVRELSRGLGADAAFDTAGGAAAARAALGLTRQGGAAVLFAHGAPGEAAGFELDLVFKGERELLGTYSGGAEERRRAFDLLASGRLDPTPLVSHRLPLERFGEAVGLAERREATKVLLLPAESERQHPGRADRSEYPSG